MDIQLADELTTELLLERCLKRPPDEAAWKEFVRRYHPVIRANIARHFHLRASGETERRSQFPSDSIEDLVQAVYMRLIQEGSRALDSFRGEFTNSFFSYLAIISINVVRDHFREERARKRPKISFSLDDLLANGKREDLRDALSDIAGKPFDSRASQLTMDDLDKLLNQAIGARNRARNTLIFKLRYFDDLTLEEIRATLGLKLSRIGVSSVLHRINARLTELCEQPKRKL